MKGRKAMEPETIKKLFTDIAEKYIGVALFQDDHIVASLWITDKEGFQQYLDDPDKLHYSFCGFYKTKGIPIHSIFKN